MSSLQKHLNTRLEKEVKEYEERKKMMAASQNKKEEKNESVNENNKPMENK